MAVMRCAPATSSGSPRPASARSTPRRQHWSGRIVDKLARSPTFEGRPDREQVEAALERITHRMLVQRDWDDDRADLPPPDDLAAASRRNSRTCSSSVGSGVRCRHEPNRSLRRRRRRRLGGQITRNRSRTSPTSPTRSTTKNRLPMRVREFARIVIAHDNECVVCQNTRDSEGLAAGVDEELYDHAAEWRTWPGYSDAERIAAEFARSLRHRPHRACARTKTSGTAAASISMTSC